MLRCAQQRPPSPPTSSKHSYRLSSIHINTCTQPHTYTLISPWWANNRVISLFAFKAVAHLQPSKPLPLLMMATRLVENHFVSSSIAWLSHHLPANRNSQQIPLPDDRWCRSWIPIIERLHEYTLTYTNFLKQNLELKLKALEQSWKNYGLESFTVKNLLCGLCCSNRSLSRFDMWCIQQRS